MLLIDKYKPQSSSIQDGVMLVIFFSRNRCSEVETMCVSSARVIKYAVMFRSKNKGYKMTKNEDAYSKGMYRAPVREANETTNILST